MPHVLSPEDAALAARETADIIPLKAMPSLSPLELLDAINIPKKELPFAAGES